MVTSSQSSDFDDVNSKIVHILSRKFETKGEDLLKEILILDKQYHLAEDDIEMFFKKTPVEEKNGNTNVTLWVPSDFLDLRKEFLSSALFPLDFDSQEEYTPIWFGKDHNIKQLTYSACFGNLKAISLLYASAVSSCIEDENFFFKNFKKLTNSSLIETKDYENYLKVNYKSYIINCSKFIDIEKAIETHNNYIKWPSLYPDLIDNKDREKYFEEIGYLIEKTLLIAQELEK